MKKSSVLGLLCSAAVFVFLFSCDVAGTKDGDGIISSTQFLGRGYDLFSSYADPLEVRGEVLDFDRMDAAGLIERLQLERADFETTQGETVEEYMSKLSQKVGVSASYAGFSGSVKVNFDEDHYTNSAYSFATVKSLIQKYSVEIKAGTSVATLKLYLTDNAKAILNEPDVPPLSVFLTYGTHVMRGILIGGRLDYSVSANMTEVDSTKSIGVFAELGYEGVFDAEVTSETVTKEEENSFNSSSSKTLKVYGGSSEYGQYIINENKDGYEPWIESIAANPVFCEFDSNEPLIPIWEFCESSIRSQEIADYFETYAADHAILVSSTPHQCIIAIGLLDSNDPCTPPPPDQYPNAVMIPQDLNEGAGGDFICLWVEYGLDNDPDHPPITRLYTVNTSHNEAWLPSYQAPTCNYYQVTPPGLDLNRDTSAPVGDKIYLAYSTGDTYPPIRSIGTYNTDGKEYYSVPGDIKDKDNVGDWDYEEMPQDLNEGAGGDTIFFRYSYDLVD
jgi:hypothetical protein